MGRAPEPRRSISSPVFTGGLRSPASRFSPAVFLALWRLIVTEERRGRGRLGRRSLGRLRDRVCLRCAPRRIGCEASPLLEGRLPLWSSPPRLREAWEASDLADLPRRWRMLCLVEIPRELKVEPELGFHPEQPLQTERGIRRDTAPAVHELVYTRV